MSSFGLPQVVLLPVEESNISNAALSELGELSKSLELSLVLAHIWEPLPFTPPESSFYDDGELITYQVAAEKRADALLERVASEAAQLGLKVTQKVVRAGNPSQVIVALAKEVGADWIVMPSHQRHGVSRWFLGSVTERVCASAPCPVLSVPVREGV